MEQTILQIVKESAHKYGSKVAYQYKQTKTAPYESLSFQQVSDESDKVSKALISLGFGYEDNIGIFSNNKPEWCLADYGIFAIRAVVVPFFGNATKEQLKYIVDETKMKLMFVGDQIQFDKAKWLLQHTDTLKTIIPFESQINCKDEGCLSWDSFLDLGKDVSLNNKFDEIQSNAKPEDLATIIYTSGTTGEPKGVMLDNANFIQAFSIHDIRLDVTENDTSFCFLPLSHVFERTWSIYVFYKGAKNIILENPRDVIDEIKIAKPTLMCTVPRFFEKTHEGILIEYDKWPSYKQKVFEWSMKVGHQCAELRSKNQSFPLILAIKNSIADKLVFKTIRAIFGNNIRMIPCSGASISVDLLKFFHAAGLFVNHGYGTTETTATIACFKNDHYEFGSCGSVMPEVEVKIGNKDEILIKGKTVFRGYYNKPKETAEVLKDGWYYSGDEGHFSAQGNLVMTDRIKDLFKTSVGKYVSPQKIELILGQDKFIEQIVTIGDDRKFVTALIVPSFENLKWQATVFGIENQKLEELVKRKEIFYFYKDRLTKLQQELPSHERVVNFTLIPEPFSVENKALTSTLKIRRKIIAEQYSDLIEQMYKI